MALTGHDLIVPLCTSTLSVRELRVQFCLSVTVDPAGTAIASSKEEVEECSDWTVLSQ